ncbi:hypothetical protein E4T42_05765 [Aureobasidium subglaciale]|nr:hypothetical protein E4T42_05765 [Aureobasidium subglaciale]
MSTNNQITGPVASAVTAVANQEFTPEQLERIKSVVNCLIIPSDPVHTPGAAVTEFLRTQDLMRARIGPIIPSYKPQRLRLVQLPAEIRDQIYRYCLVVGKIFPRSQKYEDNRTDGRFNYQKPQNQLLQVCRQGFNKAAPLYFAKNKFFLPCDGVCKEWEWYQDCLFPVAKSGFANLRSLSVTFSFQAGLDCLREALQGAVDDRQVHGVMCDRWCQTASVLELLDLTLLEVSFTDCWCPSCQDRMVSFALSHLLGAIRGSPQVISTGLRDSEEVNDAKDKIAGMTNPWYANIPAWYAHFDSNASDSEVSFRVYKK